MKRSLSHTKKAISPYKNTVSLAASPATLKENSRPQLSTPNLFIENKFKKTREKLCHTLDTYTLLIRSKNPIRCLQHNSNISIYCETEQKLLCANCIFGRNEHKFHRVTPIDKSYDKIANDVQTMRRLIEREVLTMKKTSENLTKSLINEEQESHLLMAELAEKYDQCHRMLDAAFIRSREKIITSLDQIRTRFQVTMLELKFMMENYNVTNIIRPLNSEAFKRQQLLLYEHVVASAIAGLKKFQDSDWITVRDEIKALGLQEKKKIATVYEALNYYAQKEKGLSSL